MATSRLANAILDPKTNLVVEEYFAPLITKLAIEGAGSRGWGYLKVIKLLFAAKIIDNIDFIVGTSIGGITAMLVALGYTPSEIDDLMEHFSYEDFIESPKPWWFTPGFITKSKQYLSILRSKDFSLSSGQRILDWLEDRVKEKLGSKTATFADLEKKVLAQDKSDHRIKYLSLAVSNLSKNRGIFLDHEQTPNMPLALGALASAAFPWFIKPVRVKEEYLSCKPKQKSEDDKGQGEAASLKKFINKVKESLGVSTDGLQLDENVIEEHEEDEKPKRKSTMVDTDNILADGGMTNNLAANRFNDDAFLPPGFTFTAKGANPAVLCLKVDTDEEMAEVLWRNGNPRKIDTITAYSKSVFDSMGSKDAEIYDLYSTNIIQICDAGIDILKLDLTAKDKERMEALATQGTMSWLHNHYNEAYDIKTYKTESAWLGAKTIEEVKEISTAYQSMLQTDLNEDEKKKIIDKITWLKDYLEYRCKLMLGEAVKEFIYTEHVNLIRPSPRAAIDEIIKTDLENKLKVVENEKTIVDKKLERLRSCINCECLKLHNNSDYDQVIYFAKLQERLKYLDALRWDILNKLNKPYVNPTPRSPKLSEIIYKLQKQTYYRTLVVAPKEKVKNQLLASLNKQLTDKHLACVSCDGIESHFDLANSDDIKLYLISLMLYLTHTKTHPELQEILNEHYQLVFNNENIPKNMQELGDLLQKSALDLHLATYRLEALYNYFKKLDQPAISQDVCIDYVFEDLTTNKLRQFKFLEKKRNKTDELEVELDFITTSCTTNIMQQFSFFGSKPVELDSMIDESEIVREELPFCLSRH